jgi:hypothetical protein
MTKKFKDKEGKHTPYTEGKDFIGTARFSSVYTHLGIEQSRRDDIESIGYLLVYLFKGSLPWFNLEGSSKKMRYSKIMEVKRDLNYEEFCKDLPFEFVDYFKYIRSLQFDQTPEYDYLKSLFKAASNKLDIKLDYKYDWEDSSNNKKKFNCINSNILQNNNLLVDDNVTNSIIVQKNNELSNSNNHNQMRSSNSKNNQQSTISLDVNQSTINNSTISKSDNGYNLRKDLIVNKIIFGNNKFLVNK